MFNPIVCVYSPTLSNVSPSACSCKVVSKSVILKGFETWALFLLRSLLLWPLCPPLFPWLVLSKSSLSVDIDNFFGVSRAKTGWGVPDEQAEPMLIPDVGCDVTSRLWRVEVKSLGRLRWFYCKRYYKGTLLVVGEVRCCSDDTRARIRERMRRRSERGCIGRWSVKWYVCGSR